MADIQDNILDRAVQLTQTAMGTNGGWIGSSKDVNNFLQDVYKTLINLRYNKEQSD